MAIVTAHEDERPLYQRLRTRPPSPPGAAKFRASPEAPAPETPAPERAGDTPPPEPAATVAAPEARSEPWALAEGDRMTRAIQDALKTELGRMRREAEERLAAELEALRSEEAAKLEEWRSSERHRIGNELEIERAALWARMRKDAAATLRQALERAVDTALRTEHG